MASATERRPALITTCRRESRATRSSPFLGSAISSPTATRSLIARVVLNGPREYGPSGSDRSRGSSPSDRHYGAALQRFLAQSQALQRTFRHRVSSLTKAAAMPCLVG